MADTTGRTHNAASMYLRLAEQPDDLLDYRSSRTRWLLALIAAVLLLGASIAMATGIGQGGPWSLDKAVAASGPGKEGDGREDNSGPGSGGDGDDDDDTTAGTTTNTTGPSANTVGTTGVTGGATTNNTSNAEADTNSDDTRGQTRTGRDRATGRETAGDTDRGQASGVSTRGETDAGDHTGKTERR